MIDGDPNLFIETLSDGFEVFFLYKNKKYLAEGLNDRDNKCIIVVYQLEPFLPDPIWVSPSRNYYDINSFIQAEIFEGKSFWEVQDQIKWVDD
ncbi:MAG: hypothetical protein SOT14_01490 [Succinivibrio sp.]|nr:hypothetical protein [Succinivibrio sp.]